MTTLGLAERVGQLIGLAKAGPTRHCGIAISLQQLQRIALINPAGVLTHTRSRCIKHNCQFDIIYIMRTTPYQKKATPQAVQPDKERRP